MNETGFNDLPLTGWFPGHMLKAGRELQEVVRLVDLAVELVDARAPASTRNPRFRQWVQGRPTVVVAAKADLADPAASRQWQAYFETQGERAAFLDLTRLTDPGPLLASWRQTAQDHRRARGATTELRRPVRLLIAGVPNVGKSTLVNRLSRSRRAQVGPKPGVTRQHQWVSIGGDLEALDTPGVLWPQLRDKAHELRLGLAGCIRDEVLGLELLAEFLWDSLRRQPEGRVRWDLYGLAGPPASGEEFLAAAAARRGLFRAGGSVDAERAAAAVLKDFREGRLGRVTLELPPVQAPSRPRTGAAGQEHHA